MTYMVWALFVCMRCGVTSRIRVAISQRGHCPICVKGNQP